MGPISLTGRGLLRRPLFLACARSGALSLAQQSLPFSCSAHRATNPGPDPDSEQRPKEHPQEQEQGRKNEQRKLTAKRWKLPNTPCRTRFAPSPTGYLHLGSLRTALFNYLVARATGGQFVLRIEDTDQKRLVPDAEEILYSDLKWSGLSWDEGPDAGGAYGPYRQSERLSLYKEHAEQLLREGKAYRCFCSPGALEAHKKAAHASGQPTVYPGTCRTISPEESDDRAAKGVQFAIRFKSAETPIMIRDIVYNRYQKKEPEDDYIILKRDGFPTYHFANVVDDHHMKITHVIRGSEWLVSTPKHVELYNAFEWEPPKFAHIGLLVDQRRQKLSKRNAAANFAYYKNGHILPSAVVNFCALLGQRAGPSGEILSLQDMVDQISFRFTKGDIVVPFIKLPHIQAKHLERLAYDEEPASFSLVDSHIHRPLNAAIDAVQKAKDEGALQYPPDISIGELGNRMPAPGIMNDRFRPDLIQAVLETKLPLSNLAARFQLLASNIRYYIWDVPDGVLDLSLRNGELEPTVKRDQLRQVSEAMSYLSGKLATVDESNWNRQTLDSVLQGTMAEQQIDRIFNSPNRKTIMYTVLRWALVAMRRSLPIARTMDILGREETLRRMSAAKRVAERAAAPAPPPLEELAVKGNEPLLATGGAAPAAAQSEQPAPPPTADETAPSAR